MVRTRRCIFYYDGCFLIYKVKERIPNMMNICFLKWKTFFWHHYPKIVPCFTDFFLKMWSNPVFLTDFWITILQWKDNSFNFLKCSRHLIISFTYLPKILLKPWLLLLLIKNTYSVFGKLKNNAIFWAFCEFWKNRPFLS